jgi:hypothetical protein
MSVVQEREMIVNPVISKAEKINAAMTLRDEVA